MKLNTVLYVSDLQRSLNFYCEVLPFKQGDLLPSKDNPTFAHILIDDDAFMLCLARENNKRFYPKGLGGSGCQLIVKVDDIENIHKQLQNKIGKIEEIMAKPWGDREFTLNDPDGYLVTFFQAAVPN